MNKLINRISPETSENRILHAGFSIILMSEEITQTLSGLSSDMIIFILSGSITIYSTKEEKKTIGEQYMIFLRSFENYTYDIFHIAVFAIEAEGKETYFPETR